MQNDCHAGGNEERQMIDSNDEVSSALSALKPVVALETTIFSNLGLPSPANEQALNRCMSAIRALGAVPALTAVIDGRIWAGVPTELHQRVLSCGVKIAERDLSVATAQELAEGVTTVSASLAIAERAGIKTFATGGIGGVHRSSAETGDISADLNAIARRNVLVVSAGAKAFLDLPRTLEFLETHSVPVLGWKTYDFPAFYTRNSGLRVGHRVDSALEVAKIHQSRRALGQGGSLLAVPIPEDAELDAQSINAAIAESLARVEQQKISGAQITPHVLAAIETATEGQSVAANLALAENNASIAARVAVELAAL